MRPVLHSRFNACHYLCSCALHCAFLGFCLVTAVTAPTQDLPTQAALERAPDSSDATLTFSKRVDEVQLVFTVTDKKGRFVDEVRMEDFRLLDNDRPPERVFSFQQRTELPLQVALLIDISSSVHSRFKFEQKSAVTFLKNILRPGIDSASVISFGSGVRQVQSMTRDISELETAIHQLRAYGNTALYNAIVLGTTNFGSQVESDIARRVMIILTDGSDTASQVSENAAIMAIAQSGAMVVVIDASGYPPINNDGQAFLKHITTMSGGIILRATGNAELSNALKSVEKGLRTQYALSYKPSDFQTDGSYRPIRVTLQKPKWIAHCRAGYYARQR